MPTTETSYIVITFFSESPSGKTKVWEVTTADKQYILGYIKWFGSWRKYAFHPQPNTVFEHKCLTDIAAFCEEQSKQKRCKS